MKKYLKSGILGFALFVATFFSSVELIAAPRKSYKPKTYSTKSYTKKSYTKKNPYAGYGKQSKVNGLPKNKIITGHVKKNSKGYIYVNPYARSK